MGELKAVLGKQFWAPFILQALVLLGAGWGYATSQEHRFTVIEETLKNQSQTIKQVAETQQAVVNQMHDIQRAQERLIALEDAQKNLVKEFIRVTR